MIIIPRLLHYFVIFYNSSSSLIIMITRRRGSAEITLALVYILFYWTDSTWLNKPRRQKSPGEWRSDDDDKLMHVLKICKVIFIFSSTKSSLINWNVCTAVFAHSLPLSLIFMYGLPGNVRVRLNRFDQITRLVLMIWRWNAVQTQTQQVLHL